MFPFTAAKHTADIAQNKEFDDTNKSLEAMQGDKALISTVNELNDLLQNNDQLLETS